MVKSRVAILTCNIGTKDELYPPVKQADSYEFFYYTENTLPFPLPALDDRMKGKYFKTQAHKFLDHDAFIWVDGSIEIISEAFVTVCLLALNGHDIVSSLHVQRKNVYEELLYIIDQMKAGDKYLLRRYGKQPLYQEFEYYKKQQMPRTYPYYNCFFFARWNNKKTNAIFDMWWDLIMRYSNFDQTQFAHAAWLLDADILALDTKDLFIRHKHIGYNI